MATPFDVNGKTPIAAWVPSRDDAGNGTTTLTDLVGSNNGTLTNMDPPTDWPDDTGAGGIRAIDFDGINDGVNITGFASASTQHTFSLWAKSTKSPADRTVLIDLGGLIITWETNVSGQMGWFDGIWRSFSASIGRNDGQWHHLVFLLNGGGTGSLYIDNVLVGTAPTSNVSFPLNPGEPSMIGHSRTFVSGWAFFGRLDDIRVFTGLLDSDDIGYLWNDGEGRGILQPTGNIRRRNRRRMMMGASGL